MDVVTLKRKITDRESLVLLDVRDPDEVANDPFFIVPPKNYRNIAILPLLFSSREELEAKIFTGFPVTTLIVTLCHSGSRSERAVKQLRNFGWPAENLDGGIIAWGKPV